MRRGEILGLAGVAGNGQNALAQAISGLRIIDDGRIVLNGCDVTRRSSREKVQRELAYVPEDRQKTGLLLGMAVSENLVLKQHARPPFAGRGVLNNRAIQGKARSLVNQYDIRTPSVEAAVGSLSGGNQQKVVLARELGFEPEIILAEQPTRGLDVGATEYIRNLLLEERRNGKGVLLISTELEEIMGLSDRIVVMFEGQIIYSVDSHQADRERIGLAMAGEAVDT